MDKSNHRSKKTRLVGRGIFRAMAMNPAAGITRTQQREKEANTMSKHIGPVCLVKKTIIEEIRAGLVYLEVHGQWDVNKQFYIAIGKEDENGDLVARQTISLGIEYLPALKEAVLDLEKTLSSL